MDETQQNPFKAFVDQWFKKSVGDAPRHLAQMIASGNAMQMKMLGERRQAMKPIKLIGRIIYPDPKNQDHFKQVGKDKRVVRPYEKKRHGPIGSSAR